MTSDIPTYGNAPAGDHPAIYFGKHDADYPRGKRTIVHFLILKPTADGPLEDDSGNLQYGVAVCNPSDGTSPKSKLFKIRKAMLRSAEFDAFRNATFVPDWDQFLPPEGNPTAKALHVRVVQKPTSKGSLSEVVAIKRPRDGVWESIEGKFDGPQRHYQQAQPAAVSIQMAG